MSSGISRLSRNFGNYASANWPRLWKLQAHKCLAYTLLGMGFAFVLVKVAPVLSAFPSKFMLNYFAVLVPGVVLCIGAFSWFRATRQVPPIRSLPHERYTPRFTFVLLGCAAILGAGVMTLDQFHISYFFGNPLYGVLSVIGILLYLVLLFLFTIEWHSHKDAWLSLFLVIVILMFLPPIIGMLDIQSGTKLTRNPLVLVCLALVLAIGAGLQIALFSGSHSRTTKLLSLAAGYALQVCIPIVAGIITGEFIDIASMEEPWRTGFGVVAVAVTIMTMIMAVELLAWLNGRIDTLPKRYGA